MSFWKAFSKLPKAYNNGGLGRVREGQGEPGKARMLRRTRDSQGSPGNNREGEGQFQRFVRRLEWLPWARILSVLLWMPGTRLCTSPTAGHEAVSPPPAVGHTAHVVSDLWRQQSGQLAGLSERVKGPCLLPPPAERMGMLLEGYGKTAHSVPILFLGRAPALRAPQTYHTHPTCPTRAPHAPHARPRWASSAPRPYTRLI